jgi:hypothetical protein
MSKSRRKLRVSPAVANASDSTEPHYLKGYVLAMREPGVETVNSQYNVAHPHLLPIKIAGYQRRKMFTVFLSVRGIAPDDYAEKSLGLWILNPPAGMATF